MSAMSTDDDPLLRYLLGRASDEEREDVEQRLFIDDTFEEELYATADDVMHDLLAGRLAPAERMFFERRFLAIPRHRERLAFLSDLEAAATRPARPSRRGPGWAIAAATAAAVLGGALLFSSRHMASSPERTARMAPRPAPSVAAAVPAIVPPTVTVREPRPTAAARPPRAEPRPSSPPAGEAVRSVRLPQAEASAVDVALAGETRTLRIEVEVDSDAPSFDASLRRADGTTIWTAGGLAPRHGDPLVLEVPAPLLQAQRYALVIEPEARRGTRRPRSLEYTLQIVRAR
jgi:hypothetical protein